jgi:hypothetical protein
MKVEIEVPDYSPESGLHMEWEDYFEIRTDLQGGATRIVANQAGLISLARLFLTLADPAVPSGNHWHLDDLNSLEEGSRELILEKM